jgi:putative two-component system response regulator
MKQHTTFGVQALEYAVGGSVPPSFIQTALEIVGSHHERYDGTGYPMGLRGGDIPLPGRLMSIIDVYDALVNERVYKTAYSHEEAREIMSAGRGTQFDPAITDAFFDIIDEIRTIADQLASRQA